MKHLYELSKDMKALERLGDEGEIDAQTIADTMEGIEASFNDKAIAIIHVSKRMNENTDTLATEIKRLQARKKTIGNLKDELVDYLRHNMEETGITKIECPLFTITLKKGRDMVNILDVDAIPTDYVNIETSITPDKKLILAELKKNVEIAGASLMKSKSSVLIK